MKSKQEKRKYAPYFEASCKKRKEYDVAQRFIEALDITNKGCYHSLAFAEKEPPDCEVHDEKNNIIGIEITELVNELAVRQAANLTDQRYYPVYFWGEKDAGEVFDELGRKLREKDRKIYHKERYSKMLVVIFTDEPTLRYRKVLELLRDKIFPRFENIEEAYLLFSYDPDEDYCPYIKLNLEKNM